MIRPLLALALLAAPAAVPAEAERLLIQSTTSTQNSGLYDEILPAFEAATGLDAQVVAVGTGQALKNAQNCDGDVLLTHARTAEEAFVAAGYGTERRDVMYNDFVLVGPAADPAGIAGADSAAAALAAIARARAPFASRGDDSGTHKAERALWRAASLEPADGSGRWYLETGSGMGATLNLAAARGAYALTDRATWLSFANRDGMAVLFEGDPALFNQYGLIPVSPDHCPGTNLAGAEALRDWLLSEEGRAAIASVTRDGTQLFFPNEAPN
ncbi:sulfate/tungstate uptake family ABC transporter, periplasmic substrate-binding protein [Oceanicola granulosus HTCC2516]|uniref:Sulfate/tungstate uptake family ABC transporter, periplasmic substrate-binding protein n=1 Tax=Oceanicola granulosus (strain ATCC BAA-861 / DSM 15982 / KCTC 12143 / HTCC2516) TaxID=314256 RepID=Q2CHY6_OCEGH|nr:substrate-binding domain-containing protein [Oceanicola granulosus]EAR52158.1 sulfate/tungstate uptake family ABC transporter, periplasmic substrate-binding protein [Oceanicola granulosus HTCC2516]